MSMSVRDTDFSVFYYPDYINKDGHNFQCTKFSFNDFVLTDRGSLLGKRPKSAFGKSSSCRFSFSAARNAIKYVTFGFYHRILFFFSLLGKFKSHFLRAIQIF